jgi:uncharacterized protein YegJ (DUF2314 family)
MIRNSLLLIAAALLCACGDSQSEAERARVLAKRSAEEEEIKRERDEFLRAMDSATKHARATFGEFLTAMNRRDTPDTAMAKVRGDEPSEVESLKVSHLWWDNTRVRCRIASTPVVLTSRAAGASVDISATDLESWPGQKSGVSREAFVAALPKRELKFSHFSLSKRFMNPKNEQEELLWITGIKRTGSTFSGNVQRLIGTPSEHGPMKYTIEQEEVTDITLEEISDWMFNENGKTVGAFTARVQQAYGELVVGSKVDETFNFRDPAPSFVPQREIGATTK